MTHQDPASPVVAGIVFAPGGKVYSFDPDGLELHWNDRVICQTARGLEMGRVVEPNHAAAAPSGEPLRKILRRASARDDDVVARNKEAARKCLVEFRAVVREQGIAGVKPLSADVSFDGHRVTVAYRAEDKIELRSVAPELSRRTGRRVELRQLSPREGARACGAGGLCGNQLCSTCVSTQRQPVTLRMAKDQDLPMNPGRITGLCGRLRCCLAFEHPVYRAFRERAPAVGRTVQTPQGRGVVRAYKVPEDALVVRLVDAEDDVDVRLDDAREIAASS